MVVLFVMLRKKRYFRALFFSLILHETAKGKMLFFNKPLFIINQLLLFRHQKIKYI